MDDAQYYFVFFPYIKTSAPIKFRGIEFRSTEDTDALASELTSDFQILSKLFFLRDHARIEKFVYTVIQGDSPETRNNLDLISTFQTILSYLYSSPHPTSGETFFADEQTDFYITYPKELFKTLIAPDYNTEILPEALQDLEFDSSDRTAGYEVILNNESYLWVTLNSRILPSSHRTSLNISQDLAGDFGASNRISKIDKPILELLFGETDFKPYEHRILNAMRWYNKSNFSIIDDSQKLVNLSIAFESLLNLSVTESKGKGLTNAVSLLSGDVPKIDIWAQQFYSARNEIVHEGVSKNYLFQSSQKSNLPKNEYRSLVSLGRQVFRISLASILQGAQIAEEMKLSALLETNRQRFEKICEILADNKSDWDDSMLELENLIAQIKNYWFVPESGLTYELLIATAKRISNLFLHQANEEISEMVLLMGDLQKTSKNEIFKSLGLIQKIEDLFASYTSENVSEEQIAAIYRPLFDTVWHYTFMHYFFLKSKQKKIE